ncbi:hypothetical protein MASR1M107_05250 [Ignavibacteriales bacterium]
MENEMEHKVDSMRVSLDLLNALESAILDYCHTNEKGNAYWYFADALGFKSRNILYEWFKSETRIKIGYAELWVILRITQDKNLLERILIDLKHSIEEKN